MVRRSGSASSASSVTRWRNMVCGARRWMGLPEFAAAAAASGKIAATNGTPEFEPPGKRRASSGSAAVQVAGLIPPRIGSASDRSRLREDAMRPVILLLVLVLAATSGTLARSEPAHDGKQHTLVEPTFPALTGRVVDGAGLLSASEISELDAKLKVVEDSSSDQVVVVTVSSLQGYSIEDYGLRLGNHWGVGSKESNNGVLLIVAPNESKVRIELGRGLEATLTDALSKTIIDTSILPRFRTGDFAAGIKSGAEGIARALGGGAASPAVAVTPSVPLPVAAAESAPAKSAWDEVLNQYRRRTDLIPNLAETVKAYAPRENAILDELAAARASAITPPIKASPLCSPSLKRPTTASPSHGATTSMPPGNRWCPRRRSWNSPRRRPRPMPGQQAPLRPRNQSQQNRRRRHR